MIANLQEQSNVY